MGASQSPSEVGQTPTLSLKAKICSFIQEALIEHLLSETTLVVGIHQRTKQTAGGAMVKHPPANAGDTGSSPGLGRSHMPQSN